MKGLIIKDLLNLRRQGGIIAVLVVLYMAMGFLGDNNAMVVSMLTVLAGLLPLTALSYDERAKWDKFALTMPVTRRQMVTSKYVLGIILIGCALVISLISALAIKGVSLQENMLILTYFLAAGSLFMSLLLPAAFKLGVEKSRYLMMFVLLVPVIAIIGVTKLRPTEGVGFGIHITEQNLTTGAWIGVLAAVVCFAISYCISVKVYENKEF